MKTNKLQCDLARNISIVDFLKKHGYIPKRENQREAWFLSPIRKEDDASFKVSKLLNRWYDHGIGKGGNIIDLVIEMNNNCSVSEALTILNRNTTSFFNQQLDILSKLNTEGKLGVDKVSPIRHPALIRYLMQRSINPEIANRYAKQVNYHLNDKRFFAIGLKNVSGGWELRNPYHKNTIAPKDFSLFSNSRKILSVTEGMFDFFSLLKLYPQLPMQSDFLILNSLSFIDRIKQSTQNYSKVGLYLDNDHAGKKATFKLMADLNNSVDMSAFYSSYNDLNEMLMASNQRQRRSVR